MIDIFFIFLPISLHPKEEKSKLWLVWPKISMFLKVHRNDIRKLHWFVSVPTTPCCHTSFLLCLFSSLLGPCGHSCLPPPAVFFRTDEFFCVFFRTPSFFHFFSTCVFSLLVDIYDFLVVPFFPLPSFSVGLGHPVELIVP
jgi:hypothetical protein